MTNGGSYNSINNFSVGGGGYAGFKSSGVYSDSIRKPTRLEALPGTVGSVGTGPVKKKSVPMLNTMGTF